MSFVIGTGVCPAGFPGCNCWVIEAWGTAAQARLEATQETENALPDHVFDIKRGEAEFCSRCASWRSEENPIGAAPCILEPLAPSDLQRWIEARISGWMMGYNVGFVGRLLRSKRVARLERHGDHYKSFSPALTLVGGWNRR